MLYEELEHPNAFRVGTNGSLPPVYSKEGVLDPKYVPYSGFGAPNVIGPPWDHWAFSVIAKMEFISPVLSLPVVFNYPDGYDGTPLVKHNGYLPTATAGRVPSLAQSRGAIFQNAMRLLSGDTNFVTVGTLKHASEKPVTHTTFNGRCVTSINESAWHRMPCDSLGTYSSNTLWYTHRLRVIPQWDDSGRLKFVPDPAQSWVWSTPYVRPNQWAHLSSYLEYEAPFEYFIYYDAWNTYHSLVVDRDEADPLRPVTKISYSYTQWHRNSTGEEWECDYDVEITPQFEVLGFKPIIGQPFWLNQAIWSGVRYKYTFLADRYRNNNLPNPHWVPWNRGFQDIDYVSTPWHTWMVHDFEPRQGFTVVRTTAPDDPVESQESDRLIASFRAAISDKLPDMWPATFYAAEDAYQGFMQALEMNNLENLTQLDIISTLIEPAKGFATLIRHVQKKDVIGSVMAILDLLASAKLIYEYGIAPTKSDAEEIAKNAAGVRQRLLANSTFSFQTVYGKFIFRVPDGYIDGFDDVYIVARAKARCRLNPHSLLAALLPLRAFGLMPSLANFWDLLPFSFVVDWFANIGRRLEDIDSSVQMLAIESEFTVLSMKVYWKIPEENLQTGGCLPFGSVEDDSWPAISHYIRDVQKQMPFLSYSTLDFRPAQGIPDIGIALALIFKLIK